MNYCIYCGSPLTAGDNKCPQCGKELPVEQESPMGAVRPDSEIPPIDPGVQSSHAGPQEMPYSQMAAQQAPAGNNAQYAAPPYGENPSGAPQYMPGGYSQQNYGNRYSNYGRLDPPEMLSLGTVVGTLLLGSIPLVGWILLLIWGFDGSTRPNRRNLARGILIVKLIGWAVVIALWVLIAFVGYSVASSYYYY